MFQKTIKYVNVTFKLFDFNFISNDITFLLSLYNREAFFAPHISSKRIKQCNALHSIVIDFFVAFRQRCVDIGAARFTFAISSIYMRLKVKIEEHMRVQMMIKENLRQTIARYN